MLLLEITTDCFLFSFSLTGKTERADKMAGFRFFCWKIRSRHQKGQGKSSNPFPSIDGGRVACFVVFFFSLNNKFILEMLWAAHVHLLTQTVKRTFSPSTFFFRAEKQVSKNIKIRRKTEKQDGAASRWDLFTPLFHTFCLRCSDSMARKTKDACSYPPTFRTDRHPWNRERSKKWPLGWNSFPTEKSENRKSINFQQFNLFNCYTRKHFLVFFNFFSSTIGILIWCRDLIIWRKVETHCLLFPISLILSADLSKRVGDVCSLSLTNFAYLCGGW